MKKVGGCAALLAAFAAGSLSERSRVVSSLRDAFGGETAVVLERVMESASPKFSLSNALSALQVSAAVPVPRSGEAIVPGPGRVSQIMKYGFPGLDNVRSFDDHVLSYDRRNRVPHWVFEHMTRETVKFNETIDRSKCDFAPDTSVHEYFRASNDDYKKSGFDRGHMAAAGNHRISQRHVEQTFLLTNIAPQVGVGFNRHSWNRLEKYVRKLTNSYANVYCCTGPLYLPRKEADGKSYVKYQVLGANSVAVPTHFYKVVVAETSNGAVDLECYCMPNQPTPDDTPLTSFRVPVDSVERAAGLLFFEKIPRNRFQKINGVKQ